MENADRRFQSGIIKIGVKPLQIGGHDQPFVGDNSIRQAADIKISIICQRHLSAAPGRE